MTMVQETAVAIRMLRSTYNVPPRPWSVPIELRAPSDDHRGLIDRHRALIENAARVTFNLVGAAADSASAAVGSGAGGAGGGQGHGRPLRRGGDAADRPGIDFDAERARITRDIGKAEKDIAGLEKKLSNPQFLERAPEEVIAEQRTRLADEQTRRQRLLEARAQLG